jgi:hypothetical protein
MRMHWRGHGQIVRGNYILKWKYIMWATEYTLWNWTNGNEVLHFYVPSTFP